MNTVLDLVLREYVDLMCNIDLDAPMSQKAINERVEAAKKALFGEELYNYFGTKEKEHGHLRDDDMALDRIFDLLQENPRRSHHSVFKQVYEEMYKELRDGRQNQSRDAVIKRLERKYKKNAKRWNILKHASLSRSCIREEMQQEVKEFIHALTYKYDTFWT